MTCSPTRSHNEITAESTDNHSSIQIRKIISYSAEQIADAAKSGTPEELIGKIKSMGDTCTIDQVIQILKRNEQNALGTLDEALRKISEEDSGPPHILEPDELRINQMISAYFFDQADRRAKSLTIMHWEDDLNSAPRDV